MPPRRPPEPSTPSENPWYRGSGFLLFASLATLYVVSTLIDLTGSEEHYATDALLCIVLLLGVRSITRSRKAFRIATALIILTTIGLSASTPLRGGLTTILLGAAFLGFSTVALLVAVFREQDVTADTIFTALSVYFLAALCAGFLYSALFALDPQSFQFAALPPGVETVEDLPLGMATGRLIYFSFVTLTTLGYGDITPRSDPARNLAILEAMAGQLYIAVLLARLVSIELGRAAGRRAGRPSPPPSADERSSE